MEGPQTSASTTVRFWRQQRAERARALNLSGDGAFVCTSSVLPIGSYVTLRLELAGEPGLTVLGRVSDGVSLGSHPGFAVQFVDLSPSQRAGVDAHFARRERRLAAAL